MSRLHMLPPLIYMPPPKPKEIETRKSRVRLQSAGSISDASDTEEANESGAPTAAPPPAARPALPSRLAIEAADRKPPRRPGVLSQGTLHVLLGAQEVAR